MRTLIDFWLGLLEPAGAIDRGWDYDSISLGFICAPRAATLAASPVRQGSLAGYPSCPCLSMRPPSWAGAMLKRPTIPLQARFRALLSR